MSTKKYPKGLLADAAKQTTFDGEVLPSTRRRRFTPLPSAAPVKSKHTVLNLDCAGRVDITAEHDADEVLLNITAEGPHVFRYCKPSAVRPHFWDLPPAERERRASNRDEQILAKAVHDRTKKEAERANELVAWREREAANG